MSVIELNPIFNIANNNNNNNNFSISLDAVTYDLSFNNKLDYWVKSALKTMGLNISFEQSATLYVPEISIKELEIVNRNFTQLDILLSVDLNNPNHFALLMGLLNYTVSSSGKTLFKGSLEYKHR
ncbi:MAG: LEA14-like dessication related protein [Psychromonas sp.]|jgi:LEA14-like dessication related protein